MSFWQRKSICHCPVVQHGYVKEPRMLREESWATEALRAQLVPRIDRALEEE